MTEPTFFATAADWRDWLVAHHSSETECLVGFVKVGRGGPTMTWSESVDQAICFGWIDGVRRGIDDRSYSIRFTPRKPGSNWSAINVKKVEAMRSAGLMTAAGERVFDSRSEAKTAIYSYENEPVELGRGDIERFQSNAEAWRFFQAQGPWYRRTATHWVMSAKREDTRSRRLDQLIADSAAGLRLARHTGNGTAKGRQ